MSTPEGQAAQPELPGRRRRPVIVVGYTPLPHGVAAFERAKDEAVLQGARLVVVNAGDHGNYAKQSFATAEDLEAVAAELAETGLPHEVVQPTSGRAAADDLLAVAGEHEADLIVIGIRRRSPVGKLLMGSTAQQVLLDASCPVLAVKAREHP